MTYQSVPKTHRPHFSTIVNSAQKHHQAATDAPSRPAARGMGGDMYDNNGCSPSSYSSHNHHQHSSPSSSSDEISVFLRQILLRSSSSPSTLVTQNTGKIAQFPAGLCNSEILADSSVQFSCRSSPFVRDEISAVESSDGSGFVGFSSVNVSSSSIGASENETDDCECEGEEPAKLVRSRSSSKRSRAAEVHNLSEKRRRSRINEKMKALQNLIPNSNKTDKASMLDEAIDYLKQLQFQVQMLSVRNGLSLRPMCLPEALQSNQLPQMRMGFSEESGSSHMNVTGTLPLNQEVAMQTVFGLPNQSTASNQLSVPSMSNIINSETSFCLESSMQAHLGHFQFHSSAEELCRVDMLKHQKSNLNCSEANSIATTTASIDGLQACISGRDQSGSVLLKNIEHNIILSPNLNGTNIG